MKKKIVLSIAAISLAGLITGCGSSSSSSSSTETTSTTTTETQTPTKTVKVVDGYVIGANVCDANGVCATTDGNGSATANFADTILTSTGGYIDVNGNNQVDDADIALPANFTLKTPAGKSVITPITDLIANGADKAKLAQILGIDENVLCTDPIATNNIELAKAIQIIYALKAENKEAALIEKINSFEPQEVANTDLPTFDNAPTTTTTTEETNTESATTDLPPFKVVTDLPTFDEPVATTTTQETTTTANVTKGSLELFANLAMSIAGDEAKTLITAVLNTTATTPVALEESIANLKKELIQTQEATQTEMTEENTQTMSEENATEAVTEAATTEENITTQESTTEATTEESTTQEETTTSTASTDLPPF